MRKSIPGDSVNCMKEHNASRLPPITVAPTPQSMLQDPFAAELHEHRPPIPSPQSSTSSGGGFSRHAGDFRRQPLDDRASRSSLGPNGIISRRRTGHAERLDPLCRSSQSSTAGVASNHRQEGVAAKAAPSRAGAPQDGIASVPQWKPSKPALPQVPPLQHEASARKRPSAEEALATTPTHSLGLGLPLRPALGSSPFGRVGIGAAPRQIHRPLESPADAEAGRFRDAGRVSAPVVREDVENASAAPAVAHTGLGNDSLRPTLTLASGASSVDGFKRAIMPSCNTTAEALAGGSRHAIAATTKDTTGAEGADKKHAARCQAVASLQKLFFEEVGRSGDPNAAAAAALTRLAEESRPVEEQPLESSSAWR